MLLEYVRNKQNRKVGVVVALGKNLVGWSKLKVGSTDVWNPEFGKYVAMGRCYSAERAGGPNQPKIPQCVRPVLERMRIRAAKYYK